MFAYAKAVGAEATENFTTEALAAAVRIDPSPLVRALASKQIPLSAPLVDVATQVAIEGGRLDLLLVPKNGRPVAIEIKVGAGESGNQIDCYLNWVRSVDVLWRPFLVVLSQHQIADEAHVPWLPWQQLWQEIKASGSSLGWSDFALWLEEKNMADDSYEPVSEAEVRTLAGAHGLLRKVTRILVEPAKRMNAAWPGSNWPNTEADVKKQLVNRFGRWPSYTVQHRAGFKCGCTFGVYHEETTHDAWLGIWIWAAPRRVVERARVADVSKTLPTPWERDDSSWELLGAYRRLRDFSNQEDSSKWLLDRINELEATGMFKVLGAALNVGQAEEDSTDEAPP